jgi:signal transduction histidine kinase
VQQQLVALAVNLQLARRLADTDPEAAKALLEEMERDVQDALDETAHLAERIYPPLLRIGGLAAALRSAAASARVRVRIDIAADASYPPEIVWTVYSCCLELLQHAGADARATVTVREQEGALAFEVTHDSAGSAPAAAPSDQGLEGLRDRVKALGGRLTIESEPGRGTCVAGSLPLSR